VGCGKLEAAGASLAWYTKVGSLRASVLEASGAAGTVKYLASGLLFPVVGQGLSTTLI